MSVKFDFKGLTEPFEALWPVSIPVPQDGGTVEMQDLTARFRLLTDQQEVDEKAKDTDTEHAFIKAFFVDLAPGDQPKGMSFEAARDLMLTAPYVRVALLRAYFGFRSGSPAKN